MSLYWGRSLRVVLTALFKTLIFKIVRKICLICQKICWRVTGVDEQIRRARTPRGYEQSAQVLNVVTWCMFDEFMPATLGDLLLTHKEFVHPETVLVNDHVFLWFIEDGNVVFAVGEEGKLLWKSEHYPFYDAALIRNSKSIIILPLTSFEKLADEMDDLKVPIVFCGNTSRCGSTLFAQIFEFTDRIVTFSEPNVLNQIAQLQEQKGYGEDLKLFTRRVLKVMCKPLKSLPDPVAYFMKPLSPTSAIMPVVKELYPDTTLFYMYRNMLRVSGSMFTASFASPFTRLFYFLTRISGSMTQNLVKDFGLPGDSTNFTTRDNLTCGVFLALLGSKTFLDLRKQGVDVYGIRYDDVIEDIPRATKVIFKICALDQSLVEPALRATKRDSQGNSVIAKKILATYPALTYTEEDKVRASALLVRFGFPSLEEDGRLEGTLDFKLFKTQ